MADWYNSLWLYRKFFTIQNSQVPSTQSDFTFSVNILDTDVGAKAQSTGQDILFTDSDGTTKLSHEIEKYVDSTGQLVSWVKIPSLPSATDKIIYMYYGNSSAADQQDIVNTWNSNYLMIQHMQYDPSGTAPQMLDSTSNNNDFTSTGTMLTGDLVSGKIGDCLDFDGVDDYIGRTSFTGSFPTNEATLSAWVKLVNPAPTGSKLGVWAFQGGSLQDNYPAAISGDVFIGALRVARFSAGNNSSFDKSNWHLLTITTTPGTDGYKIYQNDSVFNMTTGESSVNISKLDYRFGASFTTFRLEGQMDEVRVSNVALTSDWITTEFNNQSDPASFALLSSEETESGGSVRALVVRRRRRLSNSR